MIDTIKIEHDVSDKDFIDFETKIGVTYFNISGCNGIYLAKVPKSLKKGDYFNVYCFESTKLGCEWLGELKQSLLALATSEGFENYKQKLISENLMLKNETYENQYQ